MLIICPTCATSYMIDPASLEPAGRSVRCVRCKATWIAGGQTAEPKLSAFVDGVIAGAEAKSPPQGAATPSANNGDGEAAQKSAAAPRMPAATNFAAPRQHEAQPPNTDFGAPIEDAPSLVPPIEHATEAEADRREGESETFAARRQRLKSGPKDKRRSSCWTDMLLVLLAFNVALLGARHEVVRYMPRTASLFAAIGLPVNT